MKKSRAIKYKEYQNRQKRIRWFLFFANLVITIYLIYILITN